MCLACQMEDEELWFAYLDQVARKAAQQETSPENAAPGTAEAVPAKGPATASPFTCEELPPE